MKTSPKEQKQPRFVLDQPERAKDEMVIQYLPLVRCVAEKIHRRLPPGVDLESLVHSGVVGLLEALERFDPKRGVEFEIYARYRIQGEVMECLRSLDWVSRSLRSWGRKIEAAKADLAGKLAREPTAEEVAKKLEIPLENYYRLDQQVSDATLLSLDDSSILPEADWERTQEKCLHKAFLDPVNFVESKDLVEKLAAAVSALAERERMVVTLYHYEELTLREIGDILDLSEGRICQIFAQAVARLRIALGIMPRKNSAARGVQGTLKRKAKKPVRV